MTSHLLGSLGSWPFLRCWIHWFSPRGEAAQQGKLGPSCQWHLVEPLSKNLVRHWRRLCPIWQVLLEKSIQENCGKLRKTTENKKKMYLYISKSDPIRCIETSQPFRNSNAECLKSSMSGGLRSYAPAKTFRCWRPSSHKFRYLCQLWLFFSPPACCDPSHLQSSAVAAPGIIATRCRTHQNLRIWDNRLRWTWPTRIRTCLILQEGTQSFHIRYLQKYIYICTYIYIRI